MCAAARPCSGRGARDDPRLRDAGTYASRLQNPSVRRWIVLGVGVFAQATTAAANTGIAVLAPAIQHRYGLSLAEIGIVLSAMNAGITLGLIPWGFAADSLGEHRAIGLGLVGASLALGVAAAANRFALFLTALVAAGLCTSCVIPSSGRALMYWFEPRRRGLVVAIRQSGGSIGGVLAALVLPPLVVVGGLRSAFSTLAGGCLVAAAVGAFWLAIPGGEHGDADHAPAPLRDRRLWRIAAGGFLIFAAQAATVAYAVLFLHGQRGLSTGAAAGVLAAVQVTGAVVRLALGHWSDRSGDRIRPLRGLGVVTCVALVFLALSTHAPLQVTIAVLVVAASLTMGATGLLFAATAELAGRRRSGAALGFQQAILGVSATASPALFGLLVARSSWALGFGLLAAFPLAATFTLRGILAAR